MAVLDSSVVAEPQLLPPTAPPHALAARCGGGSLPPPREADPRDFMGEPDYVATSDVEELYTKWDGLVPDALLPVLTRWVEELVAAAPEDERSLQAAFARLRRATHVTPQKAQLHAVLLRLVGAGALPLAPALQALLVKKGSKSQSGVLVITVLTSPYPVVDGVAQPFSCAWNCHYCPSEPGQPRSYLHDEPAVRRANQNAFDPVLQFTDRAATLAANGHPVDKIELLVLGGTWASYPHAYQEAFVRDLFYAANTFYARGSARRSRLSLAEEQALNETAASKIIGLTLETRPDTIDAGELGRLRRYGCTRVQLGLQHTDDAVLRKVNRGHGRKAAETALRLLKDCCYKVDVHLMPNLPGASPALDAAMFNAMCTHPDLQADQWKIYPCEVVPWTRIKTWFDEGSFVPYPDSELFEVILNAKAAVPPWVRLNRVVRDIPSQYILGGVDAPNMRQTLASHLLARGLACRCIRCREVGSGAGGGSGGGAAGGKPPGAEQRAAANPSRAVLTQRTYPASGGTEHFLSFESPDETVIFGFVRLRLSRDPGSGVFPALKGAALIRELHVYGQLVPVAAPAPRAAAPPAAAAAGAPSSSGAARRAAARAAAAAAPAPRLSSSSAASSAVSALAGGGGASPEAAPQHTGFGRALMDRAEEMAAAAGCASCAVISGVGARGYYRKLGYELEHASGFMIKKIGLRKRAGARFRAAVPTRLRSLLPLLPLIAALLLMMLHVLAGVTAGGMAD